MTQPEMIRELRERIEAHVVSLRRARLGSQAEYSAALLRAEVLQEIANHLYAIECAPWFEVQPQERYYVLRMPHLWNLGPGGGQYCARCGWNSVGPWRPCLG